MISDQVPPECVVTDGLVAAMPLSTGAEMWAEKILEKSKTLRTDHSAEIIENGFDIATEAVKLQDFYLEAYK